MIIANQHDHLVQSRIHPGRKMKVIFDAEKETRLTFANLLSNSEKSINSDAQTRLQAMRKIREDKVYAKLDCPASDYLLILLKERNQKIEKDASLVQEVLIRRQKGVIKDLKQKNLSINRSLKSIQSIKNELEQNLEVMRMKNPEKHLPPQYYQQLKRKEELKYENYRQFRRHSYWKIPNERHQSALQLISSIQSQQKKQRQRFQRALSISLKKRQDEQQQKIFEKELKLKKNKEQQHQRYNKYKQQRQRQMQKQAQKQRKVQQYLAKYKTKAPAYVVFQQNQKKMREMQQLRMQHILSQVKEKKRRYRLSQINESIISYQQNKQKRAQQFQQKRMFDIQSQQQIKSKLGLLYKSKIRSSTAAQQIKSPDQKQIKHEKIMKMLMYSEKVKSKHVPKVDELKKQQLLKSIQVQAKKENKIQKYKDGQLILLDKNELNPRQIGLHYLQQLKQMTSLIERKSPRPPSPQEFKLVDRSLMKKMPRSKQITITNWKIILEDEKLTHQQKQRKLEDYFRLIEQQRLKASQNKRISGLSKSIQLQKKMDHYELQKAAAKLAFLKSMI